jgi:hypothetical protein
MLRALSLVALILSTLPSFGTDVPKTLKDRLFARYDQNNMKVMHEKLLVTGLNGSASNPLDYSINYDHFHPVFTKNVWPKKYLKRNLIDEYTTEEVEPGARFTDALALQETIRVRKFYLEANKNGVLFIDFYLVALDGKRIMRLQNIYSDGSGGSLHPVDFGFHFRFYITGPAPDQSEDSYFNAITKMIGQYMLPVDESIEQDKAAVAVAAAKKNISIQPGMSKEEVIQMLGEPLKTVEFGEKTFLKYPDLTVEFKDGKVADVKTN